jgi:hypothetical protein
MSMVTLDSPARGPSPPTWREKPRSDLIRSREQADNPDPSVAHDSSLLLAALEDIELRRAVLEWLVEDDLLRLCLV